MLSTKFHIHKFWNFDFTNYFIKFNISINCKGDVRGCNDLHLNYSTIVITVKHFMNCVTYKWSIYLLSDSFCLFWFNSYYSVFINVLLFVMFVVLRILFFVNCFVWHFEMVLISILSTKCRQERKKNEKKNPSSAKICSFFSSIFRT